MNVECINIADQECHYGVSSASVRGNVDCMSLYMLLAFERSFQCQNVEFLKCTIFECTLPV